MKWPFFLVSIMLVGLSASALLPGTAPAYGTPAPLLLLDDIFHRPAQAAWGTPDPTGNSYTTSNSGTAGSVGFSTDGSHGLIAVPSTSGAWNEALESGTSIHSLDATASFSMTALPTSGSVEVALSGRATSTGEYRISAIISAPSGANSMANLSVAADADAGGNATRLATASVCTNCIATSTVVKLHAQIIDDAAGPTTSHLYGRAWTSSTEPTTWTISPTDATAGLQAGGEPGVRVTNVGGEAPVTSVSFARITVNDATPPSAPTVAGGTSAWSQNSVMITACCSTDLYGAPAPSYQYRVIDNGVPSGVSNGASITISDSGTSFAQFRAIDTFGDTSAWAPTYASGADAAQIDTAAPPTPRVSGGSGSWLNVASETIRACCDTDNASGIDHYEYRTSTDGGITWTLPTTGTAVTVTTSGETLVQFRAVDRAGNVSSWAPASVPSNGSTVRIDRSLPPSGTTVPANVHLTTDTTWTTAGSPYVLAGTAWVDPGVTLTIQPGVLVEGSGTGSQLQVKGTLVAKGTPDAMITFTSTADTCDSNSTPPATWQWVGITVNATTMSTLDNVVIRCAADDLLVDAGAVAIDQDHSTDESYIGSSQGNAIDLESSTSFVTGTRVDIEDNNQGVFAYGGTIHLDESVINNNAFRAAFLEFASGAVPLERSTFDNSQITNNQIVSKTNAAIAIYANGIDQSLLPTGEGNNITDNDVPSNFDDAANVFISAANEPKFFTAVNWAHNYWGLPVEVPCPNALLYGDPIVNSIGIPYHTKDAESFALDFFWELAQEFLPEDIAPPTDLPSPFDTKWSAVLSQQYTGTNNFKSVTTCYADSIPTDPPQPSRIDQTANWGN